jgi:hypothetical protein
MYGHDPEAAMIPLPRLMTDDEFEQRYRDIVATDNHYRRDVLFDTVRIAAPRFAVRLRELWGTEAFARYVELIAGDASAGRTFGHDFIDAVLELGRMNAVYRRSDERLQPPQNVVPLRS